MLYIFSLLYIILKGLIFIVNKETLFYLTKSNIIFFVVLIFSIIFFKKVLKYRRFFLNIVDHVIQYRFKSKEDFQYSAIILCVTIISYLVGIGYLRFRVFNNPVDLTIIYSTLKGLYLKLPFGILCYNIILFMLLLYFFILLVKLIKKRLNIHITKMHFYLISFKKYITLHNYFKYHISVDIYFVDNIYRYYTFCIYYIFSLYLFGYYKDDYYRYKNPEKIPIKTKRYLWTIQQGRMYDAITDKYNYLLNVRKPIRMLFYNLHLLLLIAGLYYDILYHNYTLTFVAKLLPLLFFYQMYIFLSQFVSDKIVCDISAEINTLYYKDVIYINDNVMFINGEIYQKPDGEEFMTKFLQYEAAEFYWTRMKH